MYRATTRRQTQIDLRKRGMSLNPESESPEARIQKALREETKILDFCGLTLTALRLGVARQADRPGITASMASILTAERLDAGSGSFVVRQADDLRRLHVAVIAGTSSEDYLKRRRIGYIRVPLKDLLEVLLTGRAQVAVGDAPFLRYVARSEPYEGKITVLPLTLQTEQYGIALRDGSPWRKPVDRALLHRIATPAWQDLIYRYLGSTE